MKINLAGGTPIWVRERDNGGLLISQGKSHLLLSPVEIPALIEAIEKLFTLE